jgi:hypothetical protein
MNTLRQPNRLTSSPPMSGPRPAASDIVAPMAPNARPRRSSATSTRTNAIVAGTTTAPPAAMITREQASRIRFGAR